MRTALRQKFVWAVLICVPLLAQEKWTPETSLKLKTVADVKPSPDGRWVVWTQTRPVTEGDKSEFLTQVWLAASDGSNRIQLTHGEKSSSAPAWSPDSKMIYFASDRGGKRQLYRIAIDGGEAEQITSWSSAVGTYQLSPDGKWIAFTGRDNESEEEKARREKRDWKVVDENPRNSGLWLARVEPGTDGKREIKRTATTVTANVGGLDWSPDSRRVAFETRPSPEADDGRLADLMEVDIETGKVKPLAATGATESQPRYSPDGRWVAFLRSPDPPNGIRGTRVALLNRTNGQVRDLPLTADETPNLVGWTADSRRILYTEGRGTRGVLGAMPVDGPPQNVWAPAKGTFGFGMNINDTGSHIGMAFQSASEPPEAFVMAVSGGTPVRVSAANANVKLPPIGETRVVKWKSKDGQEIEGLLTLPVGYQAGTKVPLILNIHGGPAGAFNESFIGSLGIYPIAAFASKGWATLRPNPRGSTAYGLKFRAANLNDWGGGDYQDLMTGVDAMIAQGIADPNRLAVMGWSYGGYMTNWVVTQTSRFKAAATGAGLSNLISMWGTNDIPSTLNDYFDGPWWERKDHYVRMSPLAHADNVKTPLMVLHGEQDNRVPLTQGMEMYYGVKRKGVPAELVIYPRTPHGPQEPKFMLDIMKRHVDWVAKYIGD